MPRPRPLEEAALVVDPAADNVAVAKTAIPGGTALFWKGREIVLARAVPAAQRFALAAIPRGEPILQYGWPFGLSRGVDAGGLVGAGQVDPLPPAPPGLPPLFPPARKLDERLAARTFRGYRRSDGRTGTRNHYLVVPTSMCASEVATRIAREAEAAFPPSTGMDGVVSLANTEGCGCAGNIQIGRFLTVLRNHLFHPNTGGALVVDLGCEQTNRAALQAFLGGKGGGGSVPIDWITIQDEGGVQGTVAKGLALLRERLPRVASSRRVDCPLAGLVLGTECGASDSFSGLTANPVIGGVADRVVAAGGSAILSEIPEMVGAEGPLLRRMRSPEVAGRFLEIMGWYRETAARMGVRMSDNLVPENVGGGLINPAIKSLGAVVKGGTTAVEGVVDYGEDLPGRGLAIMQGPGNDPESVTGLASSGANVICFSTGKGTITGSAIVPVVKVSSTSDLFRRLPQGIDLDAGRLLDPASGSSVESLADELLDLVISVASGERTWAERNGQRQFQVWTAGKLSL